MNIEQKKYELLFILPGTLEEGEAAARSLEVLEMVKKQTSVAELKALGKNRLAYPVKQIRYGYIYTLVFESAPSQAQSIQEKLSLTRDLLRATIVYYKPGLNALNLTSPLAVSADNEVVLAKEPVIAAAVAAETIKEEKEVEAPAETAVVAEVPVVEKKEVVKEKPVVKKAKVAKVTNLEDIDKKLDEILSGDIISGV